jgi:hemoglobin-like flavoprotein
MGASTSKKIYAIDDEYDNKKTLTIFERQRLFDYKNRLPMEVYVAHFTPSTFPLVPVVTKRSSQLCADSYAAMVDQDHIDDQGVRISGITMFYSEFYDRLEQLDSNGKFESILSRHSSGTNTVAAKGAILIRIIRFVLAIDGDSEQIQMQLHMLGKSHAQKSIRPWQYSVFVQTLLITIASRLGGKATSDVMEAWVNLFAFVMKSMLPQAIRGQVVETELNINTSSEFANGRCCNSFVSYKSFVSCLCISK